MRHRADGAGTQSTAAAEPVPPVTAALAGFAAGIRIDALPDAVVLAGSCCLLDWLGCSIAGNGDAATRPFREYVAAERSAGVAAVLGTPLRASAEGAALANGAAAHVHDFDDTHLGMYGHPSAAVIAAALAVAEREDASGDALLEAVVAGVETTCRLGTMMGYEVYRKGFTPASHSGVFGAAGAAAKLAGADARLIQAALGLAGGLAGGLHCNGLSGAGLLQIGAAAASGVRAADMAKFGASSILQVIECEKGLVRSRTDEPRWDAEIGSTDRPYEMLRMMFKFHAACGGAQAAIDAAKALREEGASPDAVERIEILVSPTVHRLCRFGIPADGAQAKLSLPFAVAAGLTGADTAAIRFYGAPALADPTMRTLMERVAVVQDEGVAEWEARLSVFEPGGRRRLSAQRADTPPQDWHALWERLQSKFVALAGPTIGAGAAATVASLVRRRAPARALVEAVG